jgi:aspartyl/glutamyl-tRNA(Asn/Gln) amidotransferase C subunit
MNHVTTDDVLKLGSLARLALAPEEVPQLQGEIDAILDYVSTVNEITADLKASEVKPVVENVVRADIVTNQPNTYKEVLLGAMPKRQGDFMAVKKILSQDE